ncbi:MAG: DUF421 domain-containing protein [Anaerolineae bacterium]|jgi:uncharacterized membrane protein YcaP (DUF421 family)|nr:DUF421 domain-containing protein [Anaerolineae bacterium]
MDSVLRALAVYFGLLIIFRLTGRRALAQMTTFDLVLVLIISETIQQAMVGDDQSMTNALVLVLTLVGSAALISVLKQKSTRVEKWTEGLPVFVIENGKMHEDRMAELRVDEDDIMAAARQTQAVEKMDDIKHVVVENSGQISVIPKQQKAE